MWRSIHHGAVVRASSVGHEVHCDGRGADNPGGFYKQRRLTGLRVFSLNIQSLSDKGQVLELFLLDNDIDIACVGEHWLNSEKISCLTFVNYYIASLFARDVSIHGGVMILVKKGLSACGVALPGIACEYDFEYCGIRVGEPSLTVLAFYKPPSANLEVFFEKMEHVLEYHRRCKNLILCGDFNINLFVSSVITKRFKQLLSSFNVKPTITTATRISKTSKTCIDNIHVRVGYEFTTENNPSDLSDHNYQLITLNTGARTAVSYEVSRSYTGANTSRFVAMVGEIDWRVVADAEDADMKLSLFYGVLRDCIDACFPYRRRKLYKENFWMSRGLRTSCRSKRELYVLTRVYPHETIIEYYKKYCRVLKKLIELAKAIHIRRTIASSSNVMKTTWDIINRENKQVASFNNLEIRNEYNVPVRDPDYVSNMFNDFFATIADKLKQPRTHDDSDGVLGRSLADSMFLFPVTEVEIVRIIAGLNNTAAIGCDGVPVRLWKCVADIISYPLRNIINSYVEMGKFPQKFKMSKIVPVYKKSDVASIQNYRPISILPSLSKVFETVLKAQLMSHLTKHNIISPCQHGFLNNRSTITALTAIMDGILFSLNSQKYVACILCDLSKAFDLIDHKILLRKMFQCGIRGRALDMFESYLCQRTHYTEIKYMHNDGNLRRHRSNTANISAGVAQGSILGPLLFLLFMNDLPGAVSGAVTLYADDTTVLVTGGSRSELIDSCETVLGELINWFNANGLVLNLEKTKLLVFGSNLVPTTVKVKDITLSNVSDCRLLGITIDSNLQWGSHLSEVSTKLNRGLYVLRKMKKSCDISVLKTIYFAYIHSQLNYGLLYWGTTANLESILLLQKKAIRIISGLGQRESCREHFVRLGVPTVCNMYIRAVATYVRDNIDKFQSNCESHDYQTRNPTYIRSIVAKSAKFYNSYISTGIRIYNTLPGEIRQCAPNKFKSSLKFYFSDKSFYNVNEYFDNS